MNITRLRELWRVGDRDAGRALWIETHRRDEEAAALPLLKGLVRAGDVERADELVSRFKDWTWDKPDEPLDLWWLMSDIGRHDLEPACARMVLDAVVQGDHKALVPGWVGSGPVNVPVSKFVRHAHLENPARLRVLRMCYEFARNAGLIDLALHTIFVRTRDVVQTYLFLWNYINGRQREGSVDIGPLTLSVILAQGVSGGDLDPDSVARWATHLESSRGAFRLWDEDAARGMEGSPFMMDLRGETRWDDGVDFPRGWTSEQYAFHFTCDDLVQDKGSPHQELRTNPWWTWSDTVPFWTTAPGTIPLPKFIDVTEGYAFPMVVHPSERRLLLEDAEMYFAGHPGIRSRAHLERLRRDAVEAVRVAAPMFAQVGAAMNTFAQTATQTLIPALQQFGQAVNTLMTRPDVTALVETIREAEKNGSLPPSNKDR